MCTYTLFCENGEEKVIRAMVIKDRHQIVKMKKMTDKHRFTGALTLSHVTAHLNLLLGFEIVICSRDLRL